MTNTEDANERDESSGAAPSHLDAMVPPAAWSRRIAVSVSLPPELHAQLTAQVAALRREVRLAQLRGLGNRTLVSLNAWCNFALRERLAYWWSDPEKLVGIVDVEQVRSPEDVRINLRIPVADHYSLVEAAAEASRRTGRRVSLQRLLVSVFASHARDFERRLNP
jgi:hypothetical protein